MLQTSLLVVSGMDQAQQRAYSRIRDFAQSWGRNPHHLCSPCISDEKARRLGKTRKETKPECTVAKYSLSSRVPHGSQAGTCIVSSGTAAGSPLTISFDLRHIYYPLREWQVKSSSRVSYGRTFVAGIEEQKAQRYNRAIT